MTTADSFFEAGISRIIGKARQELDQARPEVRPASINFEWGGGGAALVATASDPILLEVPFPCQLVYAHLYAGDSRGSPVPVSATLGVLVSSALTFGGFTPLHGTGVAPTLTAESSATSDMTGWKTSFVTGDALIARLSTFTGSAVWLALVLMVRPTTVDIGVVPVVDGTGTSVVDAYGNLVVVRN